MFTEYPRSDDGAASSPRERCLAPASRKPGALRSLLETTVCASVADEILAGARARGHDPWIIKARCGIVQRPHPRARITLQKCASLMRTVQLVTRDSLLGFGRHPMPAGMFGAICDALVQSPDLRSAVNLLARLYGVYLGSPPFRCDGRRVRFEPHSSLQGNSPLFAFGMLYACHQLLCWLAGRQLPTPGIGLAFAPHPAREIFADLLGRAPAFQARASFLDFTEYDLQSGVTGPQRAPTSIGLTTLMRFLGRAFERRLEQRIRSAIGDDLQSGLPTLQSVAGRLAMSPQTLAGELEQIGLGFDEVRDRLRRDIALALLETSDCSPGRIAARTGFRDADSFARAFHQWMGMPPDAYRRFGLHCGRWPRVSSSGTPVT
ncbi:MAG TPA: AraC family transcriptional regulator ligand-binding domain-containing protein [Steroidobacteraceae bacterium]|nr:AraC family transcriptional regulator ligand-binding domain-containing protein [Steroidobacteraceae bacterium]